MKINSLINERLEFNKKAIIVSAYPLYEEEILMIKKAVPALNNIEIENTVDKKILAGVIIKIGSLIVDQSLKTKINNYLKHLYANI